MALPILDGNQSATTLSTILSSGQHITAHTVVSLGTQAITDIASAVSGTSVCVGAISISGTPSVTGSVSVLNFPASQSTTFGAVTGSVSVLNFPASQAVTFSAVTISNFPSTQTIAGTVTVGTLPSIANNTDFVLVGENLAEGFNNYGVFGVSVSNLYTATQTIAGSVTLGAGTAQIGSVTASISNSVTIASLPALVAGTAQIGSVTASISNSVTIASLPAISGTVTANSSNGSLTTRFGSVTTANTAFETSAVTNSNRKYLLIQNVTTASNVITVGIGFTPTTTQGIQLSSGAGLTFEGSYIPTGAVNLLSSVTASCFTILEA